MTNSQICLAMIFRYQSKYSIFLGNAAAKIQLSLRSVLLEKALAKTIAESWLNGWNMFSEPVLEPICCSGNSFGFISFKANGTLYKRLANGKILCMKVGCEDPFGEWSDIYYNYSSMWWWWWWWNGTKKENDNNLI